MQRISNWYFQCYNRAINPLLLFAILFLLVLLPMGAMAVSDVTIGVCIYNGDDTFMASLQKALEQNAPEEATLIFFDSKNDQNLQNDQVIQLIDMGVDALILNPVDRTASGYLIQRAKQQNLPIIFINREPLQEDIILYERAYYVGARATQSGELSGKIMADYFRTHPEADKNGDEIIQYVLLKGEPGHQDAELRTQYALKTLQDYGFTLQKLHEDTGMWQRALAQDKMSTFYAIHGEHIECVFANNDDMALGAIDALKAVGYFTEGKYMPVVGVDATEPAIESLVSGELLGTVLNDCDTQSKATLQLAMALIENNTLDAESFSYPLENERYVFIPYQRIESVE